MFDQFVNAEQVAGVKVCTWVITVEALCFCLGRLKVI